MEIYNTDIFEKLKIRSVNVNDLPTVNTSQYKDPKYIKSAVTDIDGNVYDGIEINGRLWMASNLRTMHYNDGEEIRRYQDSGGGEYPYVEYPIDMRDWQEVYYNHYAIRTEKLAPVGWHVSTIDEWEDLFKYLIHVPDFNLTPKIHGIYTSAIAKSLCTDYNWKNDTSGILNSVGNNQKMNNSLLFNVYPSGVFMEYLHYRGENASFWTYDKMNMINSSTIRFDYDLPSVGVLTRDAVDGCCVRCVKD